MKRNKAVYRAYVVNDQGAGEYAGSETSLNGIKKSVRSRYGAGWIVTVEKIESDEGGGWFAPVEVAKFTLRK